MQIHVLNDFTFDQTEEFLNLARLFQHEMGPDVGWYRYDRPVDMATALRSQIETGGSEPILVMRAAAYMLSRDGINAMLEALKHNPDVACVLPIEAGNPNLPIVPEYYTAYAFRLFAHRCFQLQPSLVDWRGGRADVYAFIPARLRGVNLQDDVMSWPQQFADRTQVCVKAYMHSFYDIYTQERQDVFGYLPENMRSLLDVGCSQGYFGSAVKRHFGIRVIGAEINPLEAAKALTRLDDVWQGDILKMDVHERFDCITCLDVLEHFSQPQHLLVSLKRWLAAEGCLLLSVPNVGHWSVIEALLAGHWDYTPVGIQCETHARFYTRDSLIRLIEGCGYTIERIENSNVPLPPRYASVIEHLRTSGVEIDTNSINCVGFYVVCRSAPRVAA